MANLLNAGFFNLRKSAIFRTAILLSAAAGLFICYCAYSGLAADALTADAVVYQFFPALPFILAALISLIIGTEYSDGTIRCKFIAGYARSTIYISHLLLCCAMTVLVLLAYLAVSLPVSIALFKAPGPDFVYLIFCGILASIAYAAFFTAVSMNCSSKTIALIISASGVFLLCMLASYLHSRLAQSDLMYESMTYDGKDLVYGPLVPNPNYISGIRRTITEWVEDMPFGQLLNLSNYEAYRPAHYPITSLVTFAACTGVGCWLFRKKDIR